jgi:hypothetical protein
MKITLRTGRESLDTRFALLGKSGSSDILSKQRAAPPYRRITGEFHTL